MIISSKIIISHKPKIKIYFLSTELHTNKIKCKNLLICIFLFSTYSFISNFIININKLNITVKI